MDREDWIGAFCLASLWEMEDLTKKMHRSAHYHMQYNHRKEAEYICLSIQVKRSDMFIEGAYQLIRREASVNATEMRTLGLDLTEKVLELRDEYRDDRTSLLRSHKTFFEVDLHTFGTWAEIDKEDYTTMRNILLHISKDLRKQGEREKSRDEELRTKIKKMSDEMHMFAPFETQISSINQDPPTAKRKAKSTHDVARRSTRARPS